MSNASQVAPGEVPCPTCGYDRRASANSRCPECGTPIHGVLTVSNIPWVHRRYRGRIKSYIAMLLLVTFMPWKLAREADRPVQRRAAVRFHHVSILLATLIVAAWGGLTVLRMDWWHFWGFSWERDLHNSSWLAAHCIAVLIGQPWELPAALLATYLAARCSLACLRAFVAAFFGPRRERRRIHRLSYYLSSLAVIQAAIVAPLVVLDMCVRAELGGWFGEEWPRWAVIFFWTLLGLAVAAFVYPTLFFIAGTGKRKWRRAGAFLFFYPVVHLTIWLTTTAIVFVVAGFILIAVASMLH